MISRYSRPEMAEVWSDERKFKAWLEVEIAVSEVLAEMGEVPPEAVAVIREKATFSVERILVNAVPDRDGRWARLADRVAAAIPGLWGYVGVDLLLTPAGPVVLEINPRLTTSYCGLRAALGINTAALVLGLLDIEAEMPTAGPAVRDGLVEICLEPAGDS